MEENKPPKGLSTSQHLKFHLEIMARKKTRSGDGIHIPLDLTVEILKRLPAKSIARFQCVSKQWKTVVGNNIVKNSIVTRCLSQPPHDAPHFIFHTHVLQISVFSFTYPPQITNQKNQLYQEHIFEKAKVMSQYQYVRGLIAFGLPHNNQLRLHNPTTRQSVSLPDTGLAQELFYLFGYDPLSNQYKVACLTVSKRGPEQSCLIFTVGDPGKQWRNIQCGIGRHFPINDALCINGAVYYKAVILENPSVVLVSMDIKSEKFNHVQTPENLKVHNRHSNLVNYQGNLGCICRNDLNNEDFDVWVMENAEKQEWSKITYINVLQGIPRFIRFAVTQSGEIIIVPDLYCKSALDVYLYNPNKTSRSSFVIQTPSSLESDFVRILPVTDHVENIMCLL